MNKKADSNLAAFIWWHTTFIKSICIKCLIVGIYYDVELILKISDLLGYPRPIGEGGIVQNHKAAILKAT